MDKRGFFAIFESPSAHRGRLGPLSIYLLGGKTVATVNNAFYDELGDRWYDDDTHAIAVLRAESRLKVGYVLDLLADNQVKAPATILDIACGAGFLSIPLAKAGYDVRGIDLSNGSIATAAKHGRHLGNLAFATEDALHLTAADASFDAVLLMDFLEHVTTPEAAIQEAARVLKPGGIMVFHTFNRTLAARLLAVKALEVFSRDCPDHVHVYDLFIKPEDLKLMAARSGVVVRAIRGLRPDFLSKAFFWSLAMRRVHPDFSFKYTKSLAVGYLGYGVKVV